jgi:homoserine dehydrogenase
MTTASFFRAAASPGAASFFRAADSPGAATFSRAAESPRAAVSRLAPELLPSSHTEGLRSSGSSPPSTPTIHLLGAGKVGCALLRRLARTRFRVVGATDSTATVFARGGLDPLALARRKEEGRKLVNDPGAEALPHEIALDLIAADVVVDATPTNLADGDAKKRRVLHALRAGSAVALAAKDALAAGAAELLADPWGSKVGIHAALGGTGLRLKGELAHLRERCVGLALVANVTTTALIGSLERGESWDRALARAAELGLLEADPTDDCSGRDAALKLAIAVAAIHGEALDPAALGAADIRALDPELLRSRRARGRTTRLVARFDRALGPSLAYEELSLASPLVASEDRVVYAYSLDAGAGRPPELRVHVGAGTGPDGTARAIVADLEALTGGAR